MAVSAYLAWVSFSGGTVVGCGRIPAATSAAESLGLLVWGAVKFLALAVYSLILGASCLPGQGASAAAQRKAGAV